MTAAGPIRRLLSAARLWQAPAPLASRFDPHTSRLRQRQAAEQAFLSDQPTDRRALFAPHYGDTH